MSTYLGQIAIWFYCDLMSERINRLFNKETWFTVGHKWVGEAGDATHDEHDAQGYAAT